MERAFETHEETFFRGLPLRDRLERKGITLTQETPAELEERSVLDEPFPASCSPAWFTRERAAMFSTFLATTIAGGLVADRVSAASAEIDTSDKIEDARESKARVHQALQDAARDIRADQSLAGQFSEGEIEMFAETLEQYPVDQFFAQLAELSGIPEEELAIDNQVRFVSFTTENTASNFISYLEREHPGEVTSEVERRAAEDVFSAAALNNNRSAVFLNLSQLKGHTLADLQWNTRDVLTHELLHGQGHDQFGGSNDERLNALYEGSVESASNQLLPMIWGEETPQDPFAGYVGGSTMTADLLQKVMEPMDYWQGVFKNNPDKIKEAFDAEFGEGAFKESLYHGEGRTYGFLSYYESVAPVAGILETIEREQPERAREILQTINAERRTGQVYRLQEKGWSGTFLLTDDAETGIARGVLEYEGEGMSKAVFFSAMQDEGAGSFYIPSSLPDAAFVFHDLRTQDGTTSIDEMDQHAALASIQGMIGSHADQLTLFAETEIR